MTIPRQYTISSMPTRGSQVIEKNLQNYYKQQEKDHHGYYFNSNTTDENLLLSQPLPDTVKIVNEKPSSNKKDSVLLGWYVV